MAVATTGRTLILASPPFFSTCGVLRTEARSPFCGRGGRRRPMFGGVHGFEGVVSQDSWSFPGRAGLFPLAPSPGSASGVVESRCSQLRCKPYSGCLLDVALSGFKLDQMDDSAKGFVAVPMNPEEHPKCQDPPPPYSGRPEAGPSPPPYLLQPCSSMSCSRLDTVQLTVLTAPQPTAPPPKDYVLWSLFNAMLCNFYCLGFAALAFSVKRDYQHLLQSRPDNSSGMM